MKLTATEKAFGQLTMRKADIERAKAFIDTETDLVIELSDIERCIALLRAMAMEDAPKPPRKPRTRKPRAAKPEA